MDRRALGSWLTTPGEIPDTLGEPQDFRGQDLGLPEFGPGSVSPVWRRVSALFIDWLSSLLITGLVAPALSYGQADFGLVTLAVFALQVTALQWLTGSSFGQRILGICVVRVDGGRLGVLPLLARTGLICLVIPPVVWDRDTRGLHDRAARTVCVLR